MEFSEGGSRLVILDRDGVINYDSDGFIKSPEEWEPIPGSLEAIARLTYAGFRIVVASNQSGVGRGLFDIEALIHIHDKMHQLVRDAGGEIEAVFFCPHAPEDQCQCRKPKPGLFLEIAKRLRIGLDGVPAVGDSLRDLEAAMAVSATPILVRTGKGPRTLADPKLPKEIPVFDDLAAVADHLLEQR